VSQADELLSGDEVQVLEVPRGEFYHLYITFAECSGICRSMTSEAEGTGTRAIDFTGKSPVAPDHQGDTKGQGGQADAVQVKGKGEGEGQRPIVQ
jgi:hypothetical protein